MTINWQEFKLSEMPREELKIVVFCPAGLYGVERMMRDTWENRDLRGWGTTIIDPKFISHYCLEEEFPFPGGVNV